MRTIRRKIHFVIVLLVAAAAISVVIYNNGGQANSKPLSTAVVITNNYGGSGVEGEKLFKKHCTTCHMLNKTLTGPALMGVQDRMPDTLFKNFLLYPDKTVKSSVYLQNLYSQYSPLRHPSFWGVLSKNDIESLMSCFRAW